MVEQPGDEYKTPNQRGERAQQAPILPQIWPARLHDEISTKVSRIPPKKISTSEKNLSGV